MNQQGAGTTHGSVVEYKGQWYQFYHNQSLSGRGNLRSICVDKLNFNEDGTIQMIVQTKTGVPSVGPAPAPNPKLVKYAAEDASFGGGAAIGSDDAADGGKSGQNLHLKGSYLQWEKINGGRKGGRATIDIYYAANDNSKLQLFVNDVDYSFVNTPSTGGWNDYTGHSLLTVPLKAKKTNSVRLVGGQGGVNVEVYQPSAPCPSWHPLC